jgi:hypothetical protein
MMVVVLLLLVAAEIGIGPVAGSRTGGCSALQDGYDSAFFAGVIGTKPIWKPNARPIF